MACVFKAIAQHPFKNLFQSYKLVRPISTDPPRIRRKPHLRVRDPDNKARRITIDDIAKPDIPKNYQPTKLLLVYAVRPLRFMRKENKEFLESIGIVKFESNKEGRTKKFAIVKNSPTICENLEKVKYFIRVRPIECPNGLPQDDEYTGSRLTELGQFIVTPKLKVAPEQLELRDPDHVKKLRMDREHLEKLIRRTWYI